MHDRLQFFPTPYKLASRMWSMFSDRPERLLDACAGAGDLVKACPWANGRSYSGRRVSVDAVEIDVSKHPNLRDAGYKVVGLDFLAFEGGACYDGVIMNPPFAEGVKHVLKAFDMMWEGEIVALVNAETLRNPFSLERKRLVELIGQHGRFEFAELAFKGADVQRQADVEVAIVHLNKPRCASSDWIGPLVEGLRVEARAREAGRDLPGELMLPNTFVESQVAAFQAAVRSMREAVRHEAAATYFAELIGRTMAESKGEGGAPCGDGVKADFAARYDNLKDRAWTSVLNSTKALEMLSSKAHSDAMSKFAEIKALEFNASNIYGFLLGLVESQPLMHLDMALDLFDEITRDYTTGNSAYFMGWKSNDKMRRCGWRITTQRFILPRFSQRYGPGLCWDSMKRLADMDAVFARLDGRQRPAFGLVDAFNGGFEDLKNKKRIKTSYFDIRWHSGIGTIHFFANDQKMIDQLNKVVGRHRGWIPPECVDAKTFWKQYEAAESLTDEVQREARAGRRTYDDPFRAMRWGSTEDGERAIAVVTQAVAKVLDSHGLLEGIEYSGPEHLEVPLLKAA